MICLCSLCADVKEQKESETLDLYLHLFTRYRIRCKGLALPARGENDDVNRSVWENAIAPFDQPETEMGLNYELIVCLGHN